MVEFETDEQELNFLREKNRVKEAVNDFLWYIVIGGIRLVIGYVIFSLAIFGVKEIYTDLKVINVIQSIIFAISALWLIGTVFGPWEIPFKKAVEWASPLLSKWTRQFKAASKAWSENK
jgi:hypothetical protein